MRFSDSEIDHIIQLCSTKTIDNFLLCLQLVKSNGLDKRFITEFYIAYNYFDKISDDDLRDLLHLFTQFHPDSASYDSIPKLILKKRGAFIVALNPKAVSFLKLFSIDYSKVAQYLFERYNLRYDINLTPSNKTLIGFIFNNSDETIRSQIITNLVRKEHNGILTLDLGGLGLSAIGTSLNKVKNVQKIMLWGNQLGALPDIWQYFTQLEVLNLNDNKLRMLPPSFAALSNLQKLYANGNHFDEIPTVQLLRQLKTLKYISICNKTKDTSSASSPLLQFEELVNHKMLHEPEMRQILYLGLILQDKEALSKLTQQALLNALSDELPELRIKAKEALLSDTRYRLMGAIQKGQHIAVLGIISYACRQLILNNQEHYHFSNEMNEKTTHLLLGEEPTAEINEGSNYIIMNEADLKKALQ